MPDRVEAPRTLDGRVLELDGLRGVAILLVLIWHYVSIDPHVSLKLWALRPLWSGVDLFFVLSGFLIGGILIDARQSPRLLGTFYGRRFARIIPLYALLLGAYALLIAITRAGYADDASPLVANRLPPYPYLFFLQNFWMAWYDSLGAAFISLTWSLAVEEQFYLTLPLVIRAVSNRALIWICVASIAVAIAMRTMLFLSFPDLFWPVYVLTPCRMDALMLGVLAAIVVRDEHARTIVRRRPDVLWVLAFGLAALIGYMSRRGWMIGSPQMSIWGYTVLASFYAVALLLAVTQRGSPFSRALRFGPLRRLGGIAYGVYLIHMPALILVNAYLLKALPRQYDLPFGTAALIALLVTVVVASLSWRFFERPFVRAAHRLSY